jgi:hypothetical protein
MDRQSVLLHIANATTHLVQLAKGDCFALHPAAIPARALPAPEAAHGFDGAVQGGEGHTD